jgi:NAD-dependent deacetylase
MNKEKILEAARRLREAKALVVLTGAGVSEESGVPTFREAREGLWTQYDPQQLATPAAFAANPKLVWDWYEYRRQVLRTVKPNPGHYAIAALEKLLPRVTVVTQNVDGLHQAAGSADVITLHGDITRNKCSTNCQGDPTLIDASTLQWDRAAGPPTCPHCGKLVRPDVVWYTEPLPRAAIDRAIAVSMSADVMLVVGTSGVVQPAASLPYTAKRHHNALIIDVNPVPDEITPMADLFLGGPAGRVLPQIVQTMQETP